MIKKNNGRYIRYISYTVLTHNKAKLLTLCIQSTRS